MKRLRSNPGHGADFTKVPSIDELQALVEARTQEPTLTEEEIAQFATLTLAALEALPASVPVALLRVTLVSREADRQDRHGILTFGARDRAAAHATPNQAGVTVSEDRGANIAGRAVATVLTHGFDDHEDMENDLIAGGWSKADYFAPGLRAWVAPDAVFQQANLPLPPLPAPSGEEVQERMRSSYGKPLSEREVDAFARRYAQMADQSDLETMWDEFTHEVSRWTMGDSRERERMGVNKVVARIKQILDTDEPTEGNMRENPINDRSDDPIVVEYAMREVFKGKLPASAAKYTASKLSGGTNTFLGGGPVEIDTARLEEAVWARFVDKARPAMSKYGWDAHDAAVSIVQSLCGLSSKNEKGLVAGVEQRLAVKENPSRLPSKIQSLIFDRELFTEQQARNWALNHGFDHVDVDEKTNTWRLRQRRPSSMQHLRTITLTEGVKAVIGQPVQHAVVNPAPHYVVWVKREGGFVDDHGGIGTLADAAVTHSHAQADALAKEHGGEVLSYESAETEVAVDETVPDDVEIEEPRTNPSERVKIADLQRDDVVAVKKTQWLVFRVIDNFTAWVYKWPSKKSKIYTLRRESDDEVVVFEMGGSAQRLSEDLVRGPLLRVQNAPRANPAPAAYAENVRSRVRMGIATETEKKWLASHDAHNARPNPSQKLRKAAALKLIEELEQGNTRAVKTASDKTIEEAIGLMGEDPEVEGRAEMERRLVELVAFVKDLPRKDLPRKDLPRKNPMQTAARDAPSERAVGEYEVALTTWAKVPVTVRGIYGPGAPDDIFVRVDGPKTAQFAKVEVDGTIRWADDRRVPREVKVAVIELLQGPPWSQGNTKVRRWEERGSITIELLDARDRAIVNVSDDDARDLFSDGFLDTRDLHGSLVKYANGLELKAK